MSIFAVGSLGCALAPSLPVLVAARALQGMGGSAMIGVSMALVRFTYPKTLLGGGMALYALTAAAGLTAGPAVGAGILSLASWRWLFLINLPLVALCLAVGARTLPDSARHPRSLDPIAIVLNAAALVLLVIGVDQFGEPSRLPLAIGAVAGAIALAVLLFRLERKRANPLVPVDLFRDRLFVLSVVTSTCAYAGQTSAFVALPFELLRGFGFPQVQVGVLLALFPLMIVGTAPVAGRLAERYPVRLVGTVGMGIMAAAFALVLLAGPRTGVVDMGWRLALAGIGFGLFQAPNNRAIMVSAPKSRSGAASAMVAMARVLGQATGSATAAVALGLGGAVAGPRWGVAASLAFALTAGLFSIGREG
jgi:DHA2 family multidrug resistance protein-like MFS transporter